MRIFLTLLTVVTFGLTGPAQSQNMPVVVELYTSQGCSSCPPADEILTELSSRSDVIALALHVDYWDYLGWKDAFGSKTYSKRQRDYAAAAKQHTVYTPQMIVQGHSYAVGNRLSEVRRAIAMHKDDVDEVELTLHRNGNQLSVGVRAKNGDVGRSIIQVVRYIPQATVRIEAGENAGRNILYSNIVTQWTQIGRWNGSDEITETTTLTGDEQVVVLVQAAVPGRILAAGRLP